MRGMRGEHAYTHRSSRKKNLMKLGAAGLLVAGAYLQAKGEVNVVPWQDESGSLDWGQIDVVPFDDNRNVPEPPMPAPTSPPDTELNLGIGG